MKPINLTRNHWLGIISLSIIGIVILCTVTPRPATTETPVIIEGNVITLEQSAFQAFRTDFESQTRWASNMAMTPIDPDRVDMPGTMFEAWNYVFFNMTARPFPVNPDLSETILAQYYIWEKYQNILTAHGIDITVGLGTVIILKNASFTMRYSDDGSSSYMLKEDRDMVLIVYNGEVTPTPGFYNEDTPGNVVSMWESYERIMVAPLPAVDLSWFLEQGSLYNIQTIKAS